MKLFLLFLVLIGAWAAGSWALMLEIGVAHRRWWPLVPPMGYGAALTIAGIAVALSLLVGIAQAVVKEVK